MPETFHARAFRFSAKAFQWNQLRSRCPRLASSWLRLSTAWFCALRNFVKKYNRLLVVYSRSGNEVVSKTKHSKTKTEARSTQNSKPVCPLKSRDSPLSSDQCWYSRITNRLQFKTIQVELRGAANAFPPPWTKFKKWRPPVLDVIKVYYWLPFSLGQYTSWTFFLRFSLQN